jgi:hypothetical protein
VLLSSPEVAHLPTVLWSLQYEQRARPVTQTLPLYAQPNSLLFPPLPLDLVSVDSIFDRVKEIWQTIMGNEAGDFLVFADRETYDDEE